MCSKAGRFTDQGPTSELPAPAGEGICHVAHEDNANKVLWNGFAFRDAPKPKTPHKTLNPKARDAVRDGSLNQANPTSHVPNPPSNPES